MPWYVIYTKPKAEKKTALQLAGMGVEVYCPVITTVKQWSDRKKKIEMPLFTSYIFVKTDDDKRESVFAVKSVVRYLFWLGKPAVVRDEEIEAIQKWLSTSYSDIEVAAISKGDLIEIKEGPFKSQLGLVQEVNKNKVKLIIESIGLLVTLNYKDAVL